MEFTEEWKSLWPISSTFSSPLLLSNETTSQKPFDPLIFTPTPPVTVLLKSPSLAPRLPPPYPQLKLSRLLRSYHSTPSTAASISSLFGSQLPDHSTYFSNFNALQLLPIPNKNLLIAFFPTGENFDQLGFTLLSVEDSKLTRHSFLTVAKGSCINNHRIARLLVNPVGDDDDLFLCPGNAVVGFLMVCTEYSVYWYKVCINRIVEGSESCSVNLDYIGSADSKTFKGNAIVSVCWSPHLREECLVLLDNGDLLMFDVNESCMKNSKLGLLVSARNRTLEKKLRVSLSNKLSLEKVEGGGGGEWIGCDFSWHPRIFIVAHSGEILLVDQRCAKKCNVSSVLKVNRLSTVEDDGFVALSKVVYDGFCFVVATNHLLLLCDVRKPLMPLLRWVHDLGNPRYITVVRLSELRSNAKDDDYKSMSESGYCILLGSFWACEFGLFCYGSNFSRHESTSSEISKGCNKYYAWGCPSEISLSGCDCNCSTCLVRQEFWEDALADSIDWRQKKQLVLGFGIVDADLSAKLSSTPPNDFGGFMLIRLMSSGKLEAQRYLAGCDFEKNSEISHERTSIHRGDNLLYDTSVAEYDLEKKFQHMNFAYLDAYLDDNLAKCTREKMKETNEDDAQKECNLASKSNVHQETCQKLKSRISSSMAVASVVEDIWLPTSINEIALGSTWASVPTNFLQQLACSTYSENLQSHKEALDINLPFPLRRSGKVEPSDALVGPLLSPHFLALLHELCMEESNSQTQNCLEDTQTFHTVAQQRSRCKKVILEELAVSESDSKIPDDDFVSLPDDKDEIIRKPKKSKFSYHKPTAFSEISSDVDDVKSSISGSDIDSLSTFVFRRSQEIDSEMAGMELFDVGCPVALKFGDCGGFDFGPKELKAYRILKKQDLEFQRGFNPYQDYIARPK